MSLQFFDLSFRDNYHGYQKEIKIQLTLEHGFEMHAHSGGVFQ